LSQKGGGLALRPGGRKKTMGKLLTSGSSPGGSTVTKREIAGWDMGSTMLNSRKYNAPSTKGAPLPKTYPSQRLVGWKTALSTGGEVFCFFKRARSLGLTWGGVAQDSCARKKIPAKNWGGADQPLDSHKTGGHVQRKKE